MVDLAAPPVRSSWEERLAPLGVWFPTLALPARQAVELATRIEEHGYSSMWLPDTTTRDPFAHITYLADHTDSLLFATGIANIFHRHPGPMKQAALTVAEQSEGRFILGLGVSHEPMVAGVRRLDYSKPLTRMREYLAAMDASPYRAPEVSPPPRLLAALGPRMLELAAAQADGAHPYWTTPEHTAFARELLGPGKLLCVEQKVVLSTDATVARDRAREALSIYVDLPNYRNCWTRLGFSDDEIDEGQPRFIDAVVAWGDREQILRRCRAHYDAGASHVCIQPLSEEGLGGVDWEALAELAPR